jgi:hypothetical protein
MSVVVLGLGSLVVGHAQEVGPDDASGEVDEYVVAQAQPSTSPKGTIIAAPVGLLLRDAATRMGDDPSRVRVQQYELMTWDDSSLGCPGLLAPDHVKTPGFMVAIVAGGHLLDYRTDEVGSRVLLCGVHALTTR